MTIEHLMPQIYTELRQIAAHHLRGGNANQTLQPTVLVHEAYVRLTGSTHIQWQGRTHLLAICASEMRRVLVDHVRAAGATKRGGGMKRIELDHVSNSSPDRTLELMMLDEALTRLALRSARQAKVAELKLFGGLSVVEIATALSVSARTVKADWSMAKAWLAHRLQSGSPHGH